MKNGKIPKLKSLKVTGRVKLLKALPHKGCMIYIRQVNDDIFMYDVVYNKEIYSNYLIMTPKKGSKRLNQDEINQSAALIFAGAVTTIETLIGETVDEKTVAQVKEFEKTGKKAFNSKVN